MERLYAHLQTASSSNQYDPWIDAPRTCPVRPDLRAPYCEQKWKQENNPDVKPHGFKENMREPILRDTIGASSGDMSRGQMLLPSAYDMPIVRKMVFFDTRYRNLDINPGAERVMFRLDNPIDSVSRIALVSAKVPVRLSDNAGMQANDYIMLSIGITPEDHIGVHNNSDGSTVMPEQPFARALAHIDLPENGAYARVNVTTPPYNYYFDFIKPINSIRQIEISWHRFYKNQPASGSTAYIITPTPIPEEEDVWDVDKNATVELAFFCKNRRPE